MHGYIEEKEALEKNERTEPGFCKPAAPGLTVRGCVPSASAHHIAPAPVFFTCLFFQKNLSQAAGSLQQRPGFFPLPQSSPLKAVICFNLILYFGNLKGRQKYDSHRQKQAQAQME